jgi:uncharacterized repeat protein (TIGR01451 family)
LPAVLFCGLLSPPGLVAGDVIITESAGSLSDVLRFDSTTEGGGVFIYSDNADGVDAPLADVGLPTALNTNSVTVPEVGPEGANGITYTPTAGQPGFVSGASGPVTYVFTSDLLAPTLTKTFADSQLQLLGPGNTTTLTFTVTNPSSATETGIAFSDTLPSGLIVSTPNGLTGSCGGGTITAPAGTSTISLSGATLAAGASCTFSVSVTAAQIGVQVNTTSAISAFNGGLVGLPATATITVNDLFFYWFFAESGGGHP